jgi:hypothetical protein
MRASAFLFPVFRSGDTMSESRFLEDVYLPELGLGAGTAIWGFRACAMGYAKCCCLVRGFERMFGPEDGGPMLGDMLRLARSLGNEGRRKIKLAMPGCARVSHDEASLLQAFEASQGCDLALRNAHLSWLFAYPAPIEALALTDQLASGFMKHALMIQAPMQAPRPVCQTPDLAVLAPAGSA